MSQSGVIRNGSAGGGGIDTLTADNAVAVPPDGANNINLLTGDGLLSTGDVLTNTITFTLDGQDHGTAVTIGAVTADVITVALGAVPGVYTFDARVSAFDGVIPAGAGYTIVGAVRTDGAVATLITGQAVDTFEEAALAGASAALTVSANNAHITVTGVALLTISWTADSTFTFAS